MDPSPLILVTGVPRSGTSAVAGLMVACGAWSGECVVGGGNEFQPRGRFYENREVRQNLTKRYLREQGIDPRGQTGLPEDPRELPVPGNWRTRVLEVFRKQGFTGGPVVLKDCKFVLMWPTWRAAFPDARWLLVHRPLRQIVESCLRTKFMRVESTRQGWTEWVLRYRRLVEELDLDEATDTLTVDSDRVMRGNLDALEGVCRWAGLHYDEDACRNFIVPGAWDGGRG